MKKSISLALIAIFAITFSLSAQDNNRRREDNNNRAQRSQEQQSTQPPQSQFRLATPQERADEMAQYLNLNAEQKAQVLGFFEKQQVQTAERNAQRAQNQQRNSGEMREIRARMTAESDAELEKIIGKEKLDKWREHRAANQPQPRTR